MRKFKVAVLLSLLVTQTTPAQPRSIDDFFRDFAADWVRHDALLATFTRYFAGEEQDRLERQLTPQRPIDKRDRILRARRGLAELQKLERSKMTEAQRVSADLMQWQLQIIVDGEPYLDYTFPMEQFQGANVNLVNALIIVHPLVTPRDAENYVAALAQVGMRLQEAMTESQRLAGKGILPAKFILQSTIEQMKRFTDGPPGQNPLVTVLGQKMQAIKEMPDARRKEVGAQAETIVSAQVYPAYRKAIALLESQLPRSTDDAGIWRLKGGSEAYAYFLRLFTTTNMTPDQIHELGLRQVESIERQMDEILRRLGRTEGSVKQRIEKLQADLTYPNPTSEQSRAQIMRDIDAILGDAQQRAALLFDKRPKARVIAQPYPDFQEANNAARSVSPSPDGSRPGIFLYPRRLDWMTKFGLRSVTYHEAVPGHFFQGGLQIENRDLPRFRQLRLFGFISASGEGWGLYAEHLAAESGWYEGDPEGLLGQLNFELFRARRLVVDTGIHAKHWTRQQAIDYGIEPSEVERYVVYPGQACSYMIGELKIIELRERAKKALADKFSLKEFHNVVLDTGTVPLEILERQVNSYVRSKGGIVQ
ncbi:MAG TPA: DUF885 domain-containing protein [Terriglobia bacterium]|nr:DUF885 domain-containing protein [Terriglobia bacterium]